MSIIYSRLHYPTWVVESKGNILGDPIVEFTDTHANIANIAVNLQFQGQGIGGELTGFAKSKIRERKLSEMRLATHVFFDENISRYKHFRWEETSRDKWRVLMKKAIKTGKTTVSAQIPQ